MIELGWARKAEETGFGDGVPVGYMASWPKDKALPPGWVWLETVEEYAAKLDELEVGPRVYAICWSDERSDRECPCPGVCEEANRCVVDLIRERGWVVAEPGKSGNELVDLGLGVAARTVELASRAKREDGLHHDADVLESAARGLRLLAGER